MPPLPRGARLEGIRLAAGGHGQHAWQRRHGGGSSGSVSAGGGGGGGGGGVVVFVASDNAPMRQRTMHSLRKLDGVTVVSYTPTAAQGIEEQGAAMRATAGGMLVAVIEMMILARCDALVRTGSRGYSSYSYVAAGAMYRPTTGPPRQYIVVHPCDELEQSQWPGAPTRAKQWPEAADCVVEMHTQPRLNMWWPPHDTEAERGRVTCTLRGPGGTTQTLAQRLAARGAMDLQCHDIRAMHSYTKLAATHRWQEAAGALLPKPGARPRGKMEL